MNSKLRLIFLFLGVTLITLPEADAQYFGKNKPRYRSFDFEVYQTAHYDIYHYLNKRSTLDRYATQAELWYDHISLITDHEIPRKNPLVFYNNHADFQQTNTISSTVGVTTGGVTEALKNRVTMPFTLSNQKTFQVLGHELVHAFQFDIVINGDSTSMQSLGNLPLFIVEGMAEYMSRGRIDPHTSMWMRDIVINDKIPEVTELVNPKYFPYRYGQAFWAILTGLYGDEIIAPYFKETAKRGLSVSTPMVLGRDVESLNKLWKNSLKNHYLNILGSSPKENFYGNSVISEENAGRLNLSPSISPNGKFIVFLSEKGLFSTDLYLADARTGKLLSKLASSLREADIDNLDAFESSGTWSPDSREFAFVSFNRGRNEIAVKNIDNGKDVREYRLKEVHAISNLSWSPNGRHIAFTGLTEGQSDIYILDVRSGRVKQMTNDLASDVQPAWAPDGESIVFSTDRRSLTQREHGGKWTFDLAILDIETQEIKVLDIFPGAHNLNAEFDKNGDIWFLSDRDGYRNIYKLETSADSLFQKTNVLTGISGISEYAQALSIAQKKDRISFTHYYDGKYIVRAGQESAFDHISVDRNDVDFSAASLPIEGVFEKDMVNAGLEEMEEYTDIPKLGYRTVPYRSKFKLDYASGGGGVGVNTGAYGTGAGLIGGVNLLFSDILGDNQLYVGAALSGQIHDFAAGVTYVNRKKRIQWGASLSHIPQRTGSVIGYTTQDPDFGDLFVQQTDIVRVYEDRLGGFVRFPQSQNMRFEINASSTYSYFRWDQYNDIYRIIGGNQLAYLTSTRENIPIDGDEIIINGLLFKKGFLHSVGGAVVGDNSHFGMTAPLAGYRYRVGYNYHFGNYNFATLNFDLRKYWFLNPFSIAWRGQHYARFGQDANVFYPIFIGDMGLVRGYEFINGSRELLERYGLTYNQLTGSKFFVTSLEFRIPFTGPEQLAAIPSKFLFTDLSFFIDGGVSFFNYDDIIFGDPTYQDGVQESVVVFSAGVSLRVNLFGALILEPYYAFPVRENSQGLFGINFIPGW